MSARALTAAAATLAVWAGAVLVATRGAPPWEGMGPCAAAKWSYAHFGGADRFGPPRAFFEAGIRILDGADPDEMTVVFPDADGGRVTSYRLVAHRHTGGIAHVLRMGERPAVLEDRLTWRDCGHLFDRGTGAAAGGTRYGGA